jgi:conjugal transfer mating pair stabilization protein TraN
MRDFFKLCPGADGGDLADYTDLFGSDLEVVNAGQAAQSSLLTEESATGDDYQGLRESIDRSRPDMTNDTLW